MTSGRALLPSRCGCRLPAVAVESRLGGGQHRGERSGLAGKAGDRRILGEPAQGSAGGARGDRTLHGPRGRSGADPARDRPGAAHAGPARSVRSGKAPRRARGRGRCGHAGDDLDRPAGGDRAPGCRGAARRPTNADDSLDPAARHAAFDAALDAALRDAVSALSSQLDARHKSEQELLKDLTAADPRVRDYAIRVLADGAARLPFRS